jgi:PPK2 family polyphosphate:nucleotide phosphotransferase
MILQQLDTKAPVQFEKMATKEQTQRLLAELDVLQNLLYAENKHAVLVILQGLDASGKDGAIKKVFGGLNPQGLRVQSFKVPTELELSHDFLWRIHQHTPPKGYIQLFNRSHYEDVLVTRVHGWCSDELAIKRFKAINDFEQMLAEQNNTVIFKFYLHVSEEEQQQRFRERVEDPAKHWKYNKRDAEEAKLRDKYLQMYQDVFDHCNVIPWTIVPADQNWYKEHLIVTEVVAGLRKLNMQYPELPSDR